MTEPVRPETDVLREASAPRFGTALRRAREARGLTLRELTQSTALRRDYLQALEDAQLGGLPEPTFARAYLRTYARELGLDPAPLLADFDRLIRPGVPEPQKAQSGEAQVEKDARALGPVRTALIVVLLVLLVAVGALLLNRPAPAAVVPVLSTPPVPTSPTPLAVPPPILRPTVPPPVPPQGTVRLSVSSVPDGAVVYLDNRNLGPAPVLSFPVDARARAELRVEAPGRTPLRQTVDLLQGRNLRVTLPAAASASGAQQPSVLMDLNTGIRTLPPLPPPPAPTPPGTSAVPTPFAVNEVAVRFVGQSWARVTDGEGRVLFEGVPPVGSVQRYPPGVSVRAGNAGAVRVRVGGGPERALGEPGQVLTRQF